MAEWTIETLHQYIYALNKERDKRFDDLMKERDVRYGERFKAQEQAVLKAEESTEKRLAGLNELRSSMQDQQATFMTRAEANANFKSLNDKLDLLTTRLDKSEGKGSGLQAGWGYLLGGIGGVVGLAGIIAALISFINK